LIGQKLSFLLLICYEDFEFGILYIDGVGPKEYVDFFRFFLILLDHMHSMCTENPYTNDMFHLIIENIIIIIMIIIMTNS
jgi:hypothetical protein